MNKLLITLLICTAPLGAYAQVVTATKKAECIAAIKELLNDPQNKFKKLPQKAKDRILENTDNITELSFPKIQSEEILALIENPNLKKGFTKAINSMQDFFYITQYFAELEGEVLLRMSRSTKPELKELAKAGKLDHDTIVAILKKRMKNRNIKMVEVQTALSSAEFREKLSQGAIVDFGFTDVSDHGIYTHLVQQDMTYDLIASEVGGDYSKILEFLGSEPGERVWSRMYDSFSDNITEPEWFKRTVLRPFLELTLIINKLHKLNVWKMA